MAVIAHRGCERCGYTQSNRGTNTLVVGLSCPFADCDGKIVDWVPASQLRGAVKALEHIAVHGNHDQECQRPPQDCAADALARFTTLGGQ